MAVLKSNNEFTMVDIGYTERHSNGGVFTVSNICQALEKRLLKIPRQRRLCMVINNYFPLFLSMTKSFDV